MRIRRLARTRTITIIRTDIRTPTAAIRIARTVTPITATITTASADITMGGRATAED